MRRVRKVQVTKGDLYDYCDFITSAANNMENATLFRVRQVMTAVNKDPQKWTANECSVMEEIKTALPLMGERYSMPTQKRWMLSYNFLDALMKETQNPDYVREGFSVQTAQNCIRLITKNMLSFFRATKDYAAHPEKYLGKPKLPGYNKKGGHATAVLTNQDCTLNLDAETGHSFLKLPKTKIRVDFGILPEGSSLKQVTIKPEHDVYVIAITMDAYSAWEDTEPETGEDILLHRTEQPERIVNGDLGVNNFISLTNNFGEPCVLYSGRFLKSANQWYNKKMAALRSAQAKDCVPLDAARQGVDARVLAQPENVEAYHAQRYAQTPEMEEVTLHRNNQMDDGMHKMGARILEKLLAWKADTFVLGYNQGWKQEIEIGSVNNQNFVSIPFDRFRQIMCYLCERNGIRYIEQEESYTSKADFTADDPIPTYGEQDAQNAKFSGTRRGRLYKTHTGEIIHSDLNGSANIGRKAYPDMFREHQMPDFHNVLVYKHPDEEKIAGLKKRQAERRLAKFPNGISKSKQKRLDYKKRKTLKAEIRKTA